MRNLLGAFIGAAVDRRDGDSGVKGAIVGSAVQGAMRAVVPVVASIAAGWAIQKYARKIWNRPVDGAEGDQPGPS